MSCPKSNGGLAEEDAVQIALIWPKSDELPAIAELHHEGLENESSRFHGLEDSRTPFFLERSFYWVHFFHEQVLSLYCF